MMKNRTSLALPLLFSFGIGGIAENFVNAQTIISASDEIGTIIEQTDNIYTIDEGLQSGGNLFHSFQEFGLNPTEIAHFLSQPHIENILARVIGGNPSVIDGLLQVSGGNSNLYLMNPAGIVFGANASLNVPGDFWATTATGIGFDGGWFNAFGDNDYLKLVGTPSEFAFDREGTPIINTGNLSVSQGKNLTLLAGSVIDTGRLQASEGNVTIAAVPGTNLVKIGRKGHLLSLEIKPPRDATGQVLPFDPLQLPELLTGVETGLNAEDGTVTWGDTSIPREAGTAIATGAIDVTGAIGGNVAILGRRIGILDAEIDASGVKGGGNIRIGGDYRGMGEIPNAEITFLDEGTIVRADAIAKGNGGSVILWADENLSFDGQISVRGGSEGGNGGFVETSGKKNLFFRGEVDTSAMQGREGTLLLDPENIDIQASGSNDAELGDNQILFGDSPGSSFTISESTLESLTGNVVLEATNNISVLFGVDLNLDSLDSIVFKADADGDGSGGIFWAQGTSLATRGADLTFEGRSFSAANAFGTNIHTGTGTMTIDVGNNTLNLDNVVLNTNNLILKASEIDTVGSLVTGTGNLTIAPALSHQGINIGATTSTRDLDLTTRELAILQNGFSSVTLGRTDGTGNIIIGDPGSLTQPTHIAGAGNLIGPDQNATWTLTGNNSGAIALPNGLTFSNVAKITGGSGSDVFAFGNGVNFNGFIDGGAGFDALDYSAYGGGVQVDLIGRTATGTTGIINIEASISSTSSTVSSTVFATLGEGGIFTALPDLTSLQAQSLAPLIWSLLDRGEDSLQLGRQQIGALLDRGKIEEAITALDCYHSRNFLDYLDRDDDDMPCPEEIRPIALQQGALYIFSRPEQLDLMLIPSTGEPLHRTLPHLSHQTLLARIAEFQNALAHPLHRRNTRYLTSARELYKWLIQPVENDLQRLNIETLMFVLDDGLRTLPIAALHDGEQFAIEQYAIAVLPSLHLVPTHYTDMRNSSMVAMGMSEFERDEALPAVPVEVNAIAEEFEASDTFLNETFTFETLKRESSRQDAQILHLATHGQFQPGTPSESYIQLWDKRLSLADMESFNWGDKGIELLVLSACRTAFGDETAEYGFAGLSVQSGASSAVASLWYANDAGTLALMTEFYNQLREKPTKAQALQQAQIALIRGEVRLEKEEREAEGKIISELVSPFGRITLPPELSNLGDRQFQHPYYWAGFTLIGSPW